MAGMLADGTVEVRPSDAPATSTRGALALLGKLARVGRRRRPEAAVPIPA